MKKTKTVWCLILAGMLGFFIYARQSPKVFPAASIDLRLTKDQIQSLSDHWRDHFGYRESGGIKTTVFSFDEDAKTFLEYEFGSAQANNLMHDTIPTWYWATRYCKPLKQAEFTCWLDPNGHLTSFEHAVENDLALPNITHAQAQSLAIKSLREQLDVSINDYQLIEDGSTEQPNRTDHFFTWEDSKKSFKGAKLRVYAYISGDRLTALNHYLKIPDSWKRKFAKLRSYNDALEGVATIFYEALAAGILFVFLWSLANGQIKWRLSFFVAGFYALLAFLETLNTLPSALHEYATTSPFSGFKIDFALGALWSGISSFLQIFTLFAAAETVYRLSRPKSLALQELFTIKGLSTKQAFQSMFVGFASFGIHLGWLIIYYFIGRSFKLWCPLDVSNVETLSSVVPAFSALNVGFSASLTEELTYRVLGLFAFQRLVKNFWLANILQAAAWAFMHSNYPQEPPYARGLELTIVGIFYGIVMNKFGLLACVLSHNLVDTFLGLAPLFAAAAKNMQLSAVLAITPFIAAIFAPVLLFIINRRFRSDEKLINQKLTASQKNSIADEVQQSTRVYFYKPLSSLKRIFLLALILICGSAQFVVRAPSLAYRSNVTFSREEAIKAARKVLAERNLRLDNFNASAFLSSSIDPEEFQYVFEKAPARLNSLVFNPETPLLWNVRFFKPLASEEYRVAFDATGKVQQIDVIVEESALGANLSKEEALKKVESYLQTYHPEMSPFVLDDSSQEKREKRTDWTFTFKFPRFRVGQADYKTTIKCTGDQPSGFSNGWTIPDAWKFQREIKSWRERIMPSLLYALALLFLVLLLFWLKEVVKVGTIIWRPAVIFGVSMACIRAISMINSFPIFFSTYDTSAPLDTFWVQKVASYLLQFISDFSLSTVLAAFGLSSLRSLISSQLAMAIVRTTIAPTKGNELVANRQIWLDAALTGLAVASGFGALNLCVAFARLLWSPDLTIAPLATICYLMNFANPAIAMLLDSIHEGFQFPFFAAILFGIYSKYVKSFQRFLLIAVVFSLAIPSSEKFWQNYCIDAISVFLSCLFSWIVITKLARENFAAYFLIGAYWVLTIYLRVLVLHGVSICQEDIITVTVTLFVPLIYVLYSSLNSQPKKSDDF